MTYERRITILTPIQTEPFVIIVQKMIDRIGVVNTAFQLNVSHGVINRLIAEKYLTNKQAVKILKNYKIWKEKQ